MRKAKKHGIKKGKKEIALNLLKLNMDVKQISEVTGLSIEEIESIKSEHGDVR